MAKEKHYNVRLIKNRWGKWNVGWVQGFHQKKDGCHIESIKGTEIKRLIAKAQS